MQKNRREHEAMDGQLRLSSTEVNRLTPSGWIFLEYALIAAECAAIGAMLVWLFGSGTFCQVAVGGLAGLLIAPLIPSLAAVKSLPDSPILAAACLLLWLVLVLPLLVVPSAICLWLGSVHGRR